MTRPKFFITTAIDYPNGRPHVGHAFEKLATDAFARFKRLDGHDVFFLTGTDEHGLKMHQTAAREGMTPRQLVDRNTAVFKEMDAALGVSYDRFIRTTDDDHRISVQEIWRRMEKAGDLYMAKYGGWYSVRDEAYYVESETAVGEDGVRRATPTGTPVEWTEEESWFFRLGAFQQRLLDHYEANPDFIGPDARRNEVISFVKGGLEDLSMSRTSFDWGIPVPNSPGHVMYVWVDALSNYISAAGFPNEDSEHYKKWWPADLHIIGKDIVRFHAVYWPAFLMSAGLPLPKRVFAHGFIFNKGEKMSKSVGNVLDPFDLIKAYGVDTVRYFFLREVPFGQDGNYSHDSIVGRMNADLANDLGNLAQRSLSMIAKNCGGVVPTPGALEDADRALLASADALLATSRAAYDRQEIHRSLEAIWAVVAETNRWFTAAAPWALKKTDPERMGTVLWVTAEVIRIVAILAQPVIPTSAGRLLDALAQGEGARDFAAIATRLAHGIALPAPTPIFPKWVEPAEAETAR
jgi:methionyl-tRNA synthetase